MLLQHLRAFCTVIEEGSFTKAAARLNLSQPAITKQVRSLEEEMEATLVRRNGRRLDLTAEGEVVYAHAKRVLRALEECQASLAALATPGRGELAIGAVTTIALSTLPRLLGPYSNRYPLVSVHVRTGLNHEVLNMVLRHEVDVGLCSVPMSHEQVDTIPLFRDRIVLIVAPDSRWVEGDRLTPAQLAQIPMIGYRHGSRFRAFVDASFENAGITPLVTMEFDSHEAVRTMVELNLGVAMVPFSAVEQDLAAGRVRVVKVERLPELGRTASLIVRSDAPRQPGLTGFMEQVREIFPSGGRTFPGPAAE